MSHGSRSCCPSSSPVYVPPRSVFLRVVTGHAGQQPAHGTLREGPLFWCASASLGRPDTECYSSSPPPDSDSRTASSWDPPGAGAEQCRAERPSPSFVACPQLLSAASQRDPPASAYGGAPQQRGAPNNLVRRSFGALVSSSEFGSQRKLSLAALFREAVAALGPGWRRRPTEEEGRQAAVCVVCGRSPSRAGRPGLRRP